MERYPYGYVSILGLHDYEIFQDFMQNASLQLYPTIAFEDTPFEDLAIIIYYAVISFHGFDQSYIESKLPSNLRKKVLVDMNPSVMKNRLDSLKNTKIVRKMKTVIIGNRESQVPVSCFLNYEREFNYTIRRYSDVERFLGFDREEYDEFFWSKIKRKGSITMLSLLPNVLAKYAEIEKPLCEGCKNILEGKTVEEFASLLTMWGIQIYDENNNELDPRDLCKFVILPKLCEQRQHRSNTDNYDQAIRFTIS